MKKIILQLFSICMVILLVGCSSLPNSNLQESTGDESTTFEESSSEIGQVQESTNGESSSYVNSSNGNANNSSKPGQAQESTNGESSSNGSTDSSSNTGEVNGFKLSEMVVKITAAGKTATFQLYDTTAAAEFYAQLPLELELSNFRDAQWMFYPPQKLNVKQEEAYHDGKKGELSYYEPWGDVFMLYEDFYAGDEMHRLGIGLTGVDDIAQMKGLAVIEKYSQENNKENEQTSTKKMVISIGEISFNMTFADNSSARALAELLEKGNITINMSDYGGFEKVGPLGTSLPTNNEQITTEIGDVILYQGNSIVIYYAPNSWNFTRLGKIDDTTGLTQALGSGNVTVTLSLSQ